jgi:hypothetical protein
MAARIVYLPYFYARATAQWGDVAVLITMGVNAFLYGWKHNPIPVPRATPAPPMPPSWLQLQAGYWGADDSYDQLYLGRPTRRRGKN